MRIAYRSETDVVPFSYMRAEPSIQADASSILGSDTTLLKGGFSMLIVLLAGVAVLIIIGYGLARAADREPPTKED